MHFKKYKMQEHSKLHQPIHESQKQVENFMLCCITDYDNESRNCSHDQHKKSLLSPKLKGKYMYVVEIMDFVSVLPHVLG